MQIATVRYQIATYSGEVTVLCHEDDDDEVIFGKAKKKLRNLSSDFPFGYQSFRVIKREPYGQ